MTKKLTSLALCIIMLFSMIPGIALAEDNVEKTLRSVYLHARGEDPTDTVNNSIVYMGEKADIYFAVDNPNKGDYDKATDTHKEPQYDMNGYTIRICFDPEYFDFEGTDNGAPIYYQLPDDKFPESGSVDENIGEDTGTDLPATVGYFVYKHGSGNYKLGEKTYKTAYITVFYSGGYVPQKKEGSLWYNLARLSLIPRKTGSTDVFIDLNSGDETYLLELFAKNKTDELEEQTFDYSAVNGGYHHILIKDRTKPMPPVATPGSGSYIENIEVTLEQEENCTIYYTTDGSDPATSSTKIEYKAPFNIDVTTTIRTCAYREADGKYSNTVTYTYEILPDRPYIFDKDKNLLPDIHTEPSKFLVYVSDKDVYQNISDGSEVYYTFADISAENPIFGTDPEKAWVKVDKMNPVIEIDKKRTVKLITDKMGELSDPAWYYLSIKPEPVVASHESGEYGGKIDVTLSTKTEGATIWYTTDGSDPKTSTTKREYNDIPITIAKDTTLRAVSTYDGDWSNKTSYYYIFSYYDDFGINAFYPSGVYEGSVNVTLTANNPDYSIKYRTGDGEWKDYTEMLEIDENTDIIAKAVEVDSEGNVVKEGEEYIFTYKIKPLPPAFAPESTQFTNAKEVTIYTPESNQDNTEEFDLYYTLDGTDPITSSTRIKASDASDTAVIPITKYTVISAVVLKDKESYSSVVTHSYDIVTLKPVKPLTTLLPGDYIHYIGGEGYKTQFMPVPQGTQIYYTISYGGSLCPDPVPNTEGTFLYNGTDFIDIKGNTVIKAVAVNPFGVKSDIGIFAYTVTPEAPVAAPSAVISGDKLPIVPVDSVIGSKVTYTVDGVKNEFVNSDDERFYIDTNTGNAYRDKDCTIPLGTEINGSFTDEVTVDLSAELDGIESDVNRYTYQLSDKDNVLAPPYADKETGVYEERKIDEDNNLLAVKLYSLNNGGVIQYRIDNDGAWIEYTDGSELKFREDTILQLRYARDGYYSSVVSYVYNFVPLAPIITLPSGTYLESDNKITTIDFSEFAPTDKTVDEDGRKYQGVYSIWYRRNGDSKDYKYTGQEAEIEHTMSFKAYVRNEDTGRVSKNTIHYYIIETGSAVSGSVYVAYPYDTDRISAHLLGSGAYAEGIKLLTQNNSADIHYYYTYTKKSDGQTVTTNTAVYNITRPIIPTELMDDITIVAWLEDEEGRIEGSDGVFNIDFVHLEIPTTSLEESGKLEFPKGTKYTLISHYEGDPNIILYYTTDGSNPSDPDNENRIAYNGEQLKLNGATTIHAVYYSACGKCVECKADNQTACWSGIYGEVGKYRYTVPKTVTVGGGGGGGLGGGTNAGGGHTVDNTRRYTKDIFGNEHPTHIGYISGYPDGSVRPDGYITREETAAILYRIMNHTYEKPFVSTGDFFPDVEEGRWSVDEIEYMTDKDIIYGYPDGLFKPIKNLTRAEFAALIFRFIGIEEKEIENPFKDLEEKHWAYEEIISLTETGLFAGYEDGTFKPENSITRAEVMTVVNKILGRKPLDSYVKSLGFNPFNDLKIDKWYYVTVLEATITHDYWLDNSDYEYKWENWK